MTINEFISRLTQQPDSISFDQTMAVIAEHYHYTPCHFSNGIGDDMIINETGVNEGSCKLFAFAQLNQLDENQTLHSFGQYYREDVLAHPAGTDHANIRRFMQYGWAGINFTGTALTAR